MNWPDTVVLRDWQVSAVATYHAHDTKNFVADVCPGAGKTVFSLRVAHDLLLKETIRRIVIVVHTDHLRSQWVKEAKKVGIRLLPELPAKWGREHGVVLTYQQIGSSLNAVKHLVTPTQKALVVFDEIHHVADKATWGTSVGAAFKNAFRRLLLTGTPFRHDESRITFVSYVKGQAIVDFRYGYREALNDGIVSPIYFPTVGGEARWKRGDQEFKMRFDARMTESQRADLLNTAIMTQNKWLRVVIAEADQRLEDLRIAGHPKAAGLIICKDQAHAKAVARLIKRTLRIDPVLAISNVADSTERIEAFKNSADKWLVAVRMVSEGVDIPRLRVGVFATNITTELFFRQVVGRFIRTSTELEDQSAFLYIPRDKLLVRYAREIQEERVHVLSERESTLPHVTGVRRFIRDADDLESISAIALTADMIAGDETFTDAELLEAEMLKRTIGLGHLPDVVVAKIIRATKQRDAA